MEPLQGTVGTLCMPPWSRIKLQFLSFGGLFPLTWRAASYHGVGVKAFFIFSEILEAKEGL